MMAAAEMRLLFLCTIAECTCVYGQASISDRHDQFLLVIESDIPEQFNFEFFFGQ